MAQYASYTCANCGIRRPAYDMKQEYVKEVSGKSGYSVSFSPMAGKGKVAKSVRVHSGRTYTSNRKIRLCKTIEACHNLKYFDNLRAAEQELKAFNAYKLYLQEQAPSYIEKISWVSFEIYFTNTYPKTENLLSNIKIDLKEIIKKLKPILKENKSPTINFSHETLTKENYGILKYDLKQILQKFQKDLTIDKKTFKSHDFKSFKKAEKDLFLNTFFNQLWTTGTAVTFIVIFSAIGFWSNSIMGWFGIEISQFSLAHVAIFSLLTVGSILFGVKHTKISKPFIAIQQEWAEKKLEINFDSIESNIQKAFNEYYLMCVIYYLTTPKSLEYNLNLYTKDIHNHSKKNEFRGKYLHEICQNVLGDNYENQINSTFANFVSLKTNTKRKKSSETSSIENNDNNNTSKKHNKWSKSDYIRLFNEDNFLEIVTVILGIKVAEALNGIEESETEVLESFELSDMLKALESYPKSQPSYKVLCSFLKKKYEEEILINVINNLFCISEADGVINNKEIVVIREFANNMGISKEKFEIIKENKLEEKKQEKDRNPMHDDLIYEEQNFDDIDFDDIDDVDF